MEYSAIIDYSRDAECSNRLQRCFMTGEHCSKQTNIYRERERLHSNREVNVFVIMNFSDLSDVVYQWKIRSFAESLKEYLFLSDDGQQIACVADPGNKGCLPAAKSWYPVSKVNVIRADNKAASNYIFCNRVCQQMQLADLIIADVSVENVNVFYEFGLAMAFGKLILPICYEASFYEQIVSAGIQNDSAAQAKAKKNIGSYRWRRRLFEYYGIRYRDESSAVIYHEFNSIVNEKYGYKDWKYTVFSHGDHTSAAEIDEVNQKVYSRLKASYNSTIDDAKENKTFQSGKDPYNTAVLYSLDGFLNEEQAGQCIVNYYNNMTMQLISGHCFCGDRVGFLGCVELHQDKLDSTKDDQQYLYSVGDIVRIGVNQATYQAQKAKSKPDDFLKNEDAMMAVDCGLEGEVLTAMSADERKAIKLWDEEAVRQIKAYISNRCFPAYPDRPVHVNQFRNGLQRGILEKSTDGDDTFDFDHFFCLFHVMLRSLKYTNEVVVDVSANSLPAVFWLGIAHGMAVDAIIVRQTLSDKEQSEQIAWRSANDMIAQTERSDKELSNTQYDAAERFIFDITGLWTAVLQLGHTDEFYKALEVLHMNIEQRTKLTVENIDYYIDSIWDLLLDRSPDMGKKISQLQREKAAEEKKAMESFYRDRFWHHMLRGNELYIYLPQVHAYEKDDASRLHMEKWHVDAMADLSHYLSKKKIIGKYHLVTLQENTPLPDSRKQNFISIGNAAGLLKWGEKREACTATNVLFPPKTHVSSSNTQLAQMTIWRSVPTDARQSMKFKVSLNGGSGPATFALASVLVDEDQKRQMLHLKQSEDDEKLRLLNSLQEKIRKIFMNRFFDRLEEDFAFLNYRDRRRLRYVTGMYLSTQLYQYFLPLLSCDEEASICNGLEACLIAMETTDVCDFSWMDRAVSGKSMVQAVVKSLRQLLRSFCGVEVLYQVDVRKETTEHGVREVQEIRELDENGVSSVSCLFV